MKCVNGQLSQCVSCILVVVVVVVVAVVVVCVISGDIAVVNERSL